MAHRYQENDHIGRTHSRSLRPRVAERAKRKRKVADIIQPFALWCKHRLNSKLYLFTKCFLTQVLSLICRVEDGWSSNA